MKVGDFKPEGIYRSDGEALTYGGKGINVSVILTRLGVKNKALGFAAGFTGKQLENMLKADGLDCDFTFLKSGNTRINVKIRSQSELDFNAGGPEVTESDFESLLLKCDAVKSGDFLVLAGSVPKALGKTAYEKIAQRLDGRGINLVVDAEGGLLKNVLKYAPFLVKPNKNELEALFGVTIKADAEVELYARELQRLGAKNVLVSLGGDGALLVCEDGRALKIGALKGMPVNSVGCGDSMVGGFIVGYIKTRDFDYALRLGTACAGATAFCDGLAKKEEIINSADNLGISI